MAGYSGDLYSNTPGVHYGCSIVNSKNHDCDTSYGASGSSIFAFFNGKPFVVGLHWGNSGAGNYNTYTTPSTYTNRITELRKNNEGKSNRTYVLLCNRSKFNKIYSAIAYYDNGWTSKGWYALDKDTCKEVPVLTSRPYNGYIFLYAKTGSTNWGSGQYRFCVRSGGAFNISNADKTCNQTSKDSFAKFGKALTVKANSLNSWNFN